MRKKKLVIMLAVVALSAALFFFYLGRPQKSESIRSTGIIEGTEVNLSPKVSGRLSFVCCNEGD
ncbi:MAG TPA: hypothetical protein VK435_02075, partial [Thermodesulfovibrionales bacterium]|nr:hypothetical protein [Thermodesulfovibrionales bacterium]